MTSKGTEIGDRSIMHHLYANVVAVVLWFTCELIRRNIHSGSRSPITLLWTKCHFNGDSGSGRMPLPLPSPRHIGRDFTPTTTITTPSLLYTLHFDMHDRRISQALWLFFIPFHFISFHSFTDSASDTRHSMDSISLRTDDNTLSPFIITIIKYASLQSDRTSCGVRETHSLMFMITAMCTHVEM